MSNPKVKNVPKSLQKNTYLTLPMVVVKEYTIDEVKRAMENYGYSYSNEELLEYLTSAYFRKRLKVYLEVIELGHVNPEYYIELYTFP